MKIYWTIKSIPELTALPRDLRKKNYNDAMRQLRHHREFWFTALLNVLLIILFSYLLEWLYRGESTGLWYMTRLMIATVPASFVCQQLNVAVIRKYYPHLLSRTQ